MSGRLVEWPEPGKVSVYTTKRVGSGNSGIVEMGSGPGRAKVGVCEWRIEVEDILLDDDRQTRDCK